MEHFVMFQRTLQCIILYTCKYIDTYLYRCTTLNSMHNIVKLYIILFSDGVICHAAATNVSTYVQYNNGLYECIHF